MEFRSYGKTEDASTQTGDVFFTGIDAFSDARALQPGMVQESKNLRIKQGRFVTRPSTRSLIANYTSGSSILTGGVFRKYGTIFAVTTDSIDLYSASSTVPVSYPFPAGTTLSAADQPFAIQAYNKVIIFRKTGRPLEFDGSAVSLKSTVDPGAGGEYGPDSPFGLWIASRLVVRDGANKDAIMVSRTNFPDDFLRTEGEFVMGAGSGDEVRGIMSFMENQMLVFMRHSIHIINTIHSPINSTVAEITRQHGCLGPRCIAQSGASTYFFSDHGSFALTPQTDPGKGLSVAITKAVGASLPMSRGIQSTMDRVNMDDDVVGQYRLAIHDNKLFALVCLDGAVVPNAVLCFDLLLNAWISVDEYQFSINDIFYGLDPTTKKKTLYAITDGSIYALSGTDGIDHANDGSTTPIATSLTTRSYTFGPALISRFNRASADITGDDATIGIEASLENPDVVFDVRPVAALVDERHARFRIRKRGQACSLKFAGTGKVSVRGVSIEGVPEKIRRTADAS